MRPNNWTQLCLIFLLWVMTAVAARAQVFNTLLSFDGANGYAPGSRMSLIQGIDGDFYGTTSEGGAYGHGNIFRLSSDGILTTIYSFCSQSGCEDGYYPNAGLILGADGNFYGTTFYGGGSNQICRQGCGTIFKVTPQGTQKTLYTFCAQSNCKDGLYPTAPLTLATDGNFYGTTYGDNLNRHGTVFRITPGGTLTTIHNFRGGSDDEYPQAGLIQATDGYLYGTGRNTAFRVTRAGGLTPIYTFCSQPNCTDGGDPAGGLVQASDGNFYGTTNQGGANGLGGTVFSLTPSGILTTLYSFCGQANCPDGFESYSGLVQATDGNFYGTTSRGGAAAAGTVFQVTSAGSLTTLHSFCTESGCDDGAGPQSGLFQATNGTVYGSTPVDGSNACECGTIFTLSMGLGPFVSLPRSWGKMGSTTFVFGQGLTRTSDVSFDGTPAHFTVVSDTLLKAKVPTGATTGYVTVTTPSGTLTSNVPFHVIP